MYSFTSLTLRRNLPRSQHLNSLAANLVRFQKTKAIPLEGKGQENSDSANQEAEKSFVRPFEDIPGPKRNMKSVAEFYYKSERFSKGYKMFDVLFEKYGPIYKENMIMPGPPSVHLLDPDDHEKVLRAEGKYPSRPMVDFWLEQRTRRNYFPGILLL